MRKQILQIIGTQTMFQLVMLILITTVLVGLPACSSDEDALLNEGETSTHAESDIVTALREYNNSLTSVSQNRGIGWL
ncbi:MAG: hypothetical protein ACI30D_05295 [Muribaculaceae bacterium]